MFYLTKTHNSVVTRRFSIWSMQNTDITLSVDNKHMFTVFAACQWIFFFFCVLFSVFWFLFPLFLAKKILNYCNQLLQPLSLLTQYHTIRWLKPNFTCMIKQNKPNCTPVIKQNKTKIYAKRKPTFFIIYTNIFLVWLITISILNLLNTTHLLSHLNVTPTQN